MEQQYIVDDYKQLEQVIGRYNPAKVFLVCGKSFDKMSFGKELLNILATHGITLVRFSDFSPNPVYESVYQGVKLFTSSKASMIIAVGGGSALDVAKCIKLYSNMDLSVNFLQQKIKKNDIPLLAVPTTAGTGSESTRYAVIYYQENKQSVTHDSAIPAVVFFAPATLDSVPEYHKKASLLDALSHAIESFWSVNANEKSRSYAKQAISIILDNIDEYMGGNKESNVQMMKAANLAGKAINITQTTAGHAMCYKLTSKFGYAHGHSAALCNAVLWPYMIAHGGNLELFIELAKCFGQERALEGAQAFREIIHEFSLDIPSITDEELLKELTATVNPVRLQNNPVQLETAVIYDLYKQVGNI